MGSYLDKSTLSVNTMVSHSGEHGMAPFRILNISEPKPMDSREIAEDVHTDHETREVFNYNHCR